MERAPLSAPFPRMNSRRWMAGSSAPSFGLASPSSSRTLFKQEGIQVSLALLLSFPFFIELHPVQFPDIFLRRQACEIALLRPKTFREDYFQGNPRHSKSPGRPPASLAFGQKFW